MSIDANGLRTFKRRNSTISIYKNNGRMCVTKKYHANYSVAREAESYGAAETVLRDIPYMQLAKIDGIDVLSQELHMEYVEGSCLSDSLAREGVQSLRTDWVSSLVLFSARSQNTGWSFDIDPSNFIVTGDGNWLTFVDPILEVEGVDHVTFVVFLWGLVKYRIRYIYRISDWLLFARRWQLCLDLYAETAQISRKLIYRQLASYSSVVIRWNLHESEAERRGVRILRILFVVPTWWLLHLLFRIFARGA